MFMKINTRRKKDYTDYYIIMRRKKKSKSKVHVLVYLETSANSVSTIFRYSSKPPSILFTVPLPQTHNSLQTLRINRSSWDTSMTPPYNKSNMIGVKQNTEFGFYRIFQKLETTLGAD